MNTKTKVTSSRVVELVYTSESQMRRPRQLISGLVADLAASRELAWRLLVRNIRAQYRQSLFGYFWALAVPLASTAMWCFLHSQRILSFESQDVPYAAYVLVGILLWQTFVQALTEPMKILDNSRPMLSKINFPREALILTAVGQVMFSVAIRLVLIVGVLVWLQRPLPATALLFPLGILALVALGLTLGLLAAPLSAFYGDVGHFISTVTGIWMFLTPVIYLPSKTGWGALLNRFNPVSPLLVATRDWLLWGQTTCLPGFCAVCTATAAVLIGALFIYRVAMPIMIERMSA